jgi:hypothetical protein
MVLTLSEYLLAFDAADDGLMQDSGCPHPFARCSPIHIGPGKTGRGGPVSVPSNLAMLSVAERTFQLTILREFLSRSFSQYIPLRCEIPRNGQLDQSQYLSASRLTNRLYSRGLRQPKKCGHEVPPWKD